MTMTLEQRIANLSPTKRALLEEHLQAKMRGQRMVQQSIPKQNTESFAAPLL